MVSLTKEDLEYINNYYEKNGEIMVIDVDKKERLCIISIPIIDGQEDIYDCHKALVIPIDYNYDGEDCDIYNVPDMLDEDEINVIIESIIESYEE